MNSLLSKELQDARLHIEELVKDLHSLALDIGKKEMANRLDQLRESIKEPFLFVIVGEVKAGKSSFINALLGAGKEVAKVAPQPMTDTVQQILYSEDERTVEVNPYLKKIFLPVEILSEISIVDTPGTNTIVDHHQEITERFVPGSDLVVFVFEAKNPYRQSAWDFFEYIHGDWKRKVIFVLQQKDLMNPEDLKVNIEGVRAQAEKKGIQEPVVFAVSALEEQSGKKEQSGFKPLNDYIRANITGGKAAVIKLNNSIDTTDHMLEKVNGGLLERKTAFETDVIFRKDINHALSKNEKLSQRQIQTLTENLVNAYERSTRKKEEELAKGISFTSLFGRAIAGLFSKGSGTKEWLENFTKNMQTDLTKELSGRLKDGVNDVAESLQNMTQTVHLLVQQKAMNLPSDHVFFSEVADKRAAILLELQEAFDRFITKNDSFEGKDLFADRDKLSSNLLTGSGVAVIGAVLAAVTQVAVFDITGGVLTTLGLAFAGVSTTIKKRKLLKEYRQEVEKGKKDLEEEVSSKLETYAGLIKDRIEEQFKPLDKHLAEEEHHVNALESRIEGMNKRIYDLRLKIAEK